MRFVEALERHWVLVTLIVIGASLRIVVNNVTAFSQADETVYLNYSRAIETGRSGYEGIVRYVIATPAAWPFPNPSRWSAFGVQALACRLLGNCDYRTLALVSTFSGIALLPVVYAVALRLTSRIAAVLSTAFVATSPLLLGLGRRALQDEFFVLVVWIAMWAVLRVLDKPPRLRDHGLAVVALGIAFAAKESFILFYVAFATAYLVRPRRKPHWLDLSLVVGPLVVWVGGFVLFAGSPADLVALERIALLGRASPGAYEVVYGSGPFYEPLLDFLILSPATTVVAIAGIGAAVVGSSPVGIRRLILVMSTCFVGFGVLPKDIRYAAAMVPMLAIVAAWALDAKLLTPRGIVRPGGVAATMVAAATDGWVFWMVFLVAAVYDPIMTNLLRALHAIP